MCHSWVIFSLGENDGGTRSVRGILSSGYLGYRDEAQSEREASLLVPG